MSDIGDQIERGSDGPEWQHVPIWKCETKDDAIEQANALARIAAVQRDTGWTPEPWIVRRDIGSIHADATGDAICTAGESVGGEYFANSLRIVTCVNACAGLSDPAADLARLRADLAAERERVRVLREACRAWQDWCRLDQQSRAHPDAPVLQEKRVTAFRTAEQLTTIALAATEPTP